MNHNLEDRMATESQPYECDACGADVSFDDNVCPNCGADISEVDDGFGEENTGTWNPAVEGKSKTPLIAIGIVILMIGVALIIISSNLLRLLHPQLQREAEAIRALEGPILLCGIGLLIVGGIISAKGFGQYMSAQQTPSRAPTTQPVVTHAVSPQSVELGNTPDEVQSVMGQPDKIINLGARVIHVYKDMKIIYIDGKVSDVQL